LVSQWRIRYKLWLCTGLLLVMMGTLAVSGFYGLYAYRGLVKTLSGRSTELPLAAELSHQVSDLRVTLSGMRSRLEFPGGVEEHGPLDAQFQREQFRTNLHSIESTIERYRIQLNGNSTREDWHIRDDTQERETLTKIEAALARLETADDDYAWMFDEVKTEKLAGEVDRLHALAAKLPTFLRVRLRDLSDDVRVQYRSAIILTWFTTIASLVTFVVLMSSLHRWITRPLEVLIAGSRQVAQGNFSYRTELATNDEMSELADALNDMTDRFQAIRDDLDKQVRERTRQVVRSEQLASVGFLAAGVAHEINNPLASIAFCAESLERRIFEHAVSTGAEQDVVRSYVQMIQNEAFRCKEITEKLLDFSRTGDVQRQTTEMRELVTGTIEMVGHLGRYRGKQIELLPGDFVHAEVSQQEMKQVLLNLITNALDSVDANGRVTVEIQTVGRQVQLTFVDDGCGMTEEVQKHLFEPFFTRRRGGQGTGLGLSISYRIIEDHRGHIEAFSDGPGCGSRFTVTLPRCVSELEKERDNRYQAA
jgi:signal transduction histidine kinase